MTKKSEKVKDDAIDIIIPPAENITTGQEFTNQCVFKIVPVCTNRMEEPVVSILIVRNK